jgi:general secretion pathway protein M
MNNASYTSNQVDTRAPAHNLSTALGHAWAQHNRQKKVLLILCALPLVLVSIWSLAVAPAWRTWQEAPARQDHLESQNQLMQQLQAQAQTLQMLRLVTRDEALTWLEKNLDDLGPEARINHQDEYVSLSLKAAPALALARWLSEAREHAQALPVQADLQSSITPAPPSPTSSTIAPLLVDRQHSREDILWSGVLLLRVPSRN